jgi:hypothetical protein
MAKRDAEKAAKFCEDSKSESSLACIARGVLEEFDTRHGSSEYRALRDAFRKSHGATAWGIVNDIVVEFRHFAR